MAVPKVTSVPKLVDVTDKALPIDAYLLTDEQQEQLRKAEFALRDRCMARFGIDYQSPPPLDAYKPKSRTQLRYGSTDVEEVRNYGYKPAGSEKEVQKTMPEKLSPQVTMVLTGTDDPNVKPGSAAAKGGQDYNGQKVPKGGCIGEAAAKLGATGGEKLGDADRANWVNAESWGKSYESSQVREAFKSWSACMKEKGYSYPDPMKVNDDPEWQKQPTATAREKAVAVADVTCKEKNNVVGVWYTVEVAVQKQLIEQHAQELDAVKKSIENRMKQAAQALS